MNNKTNLKVVDATSQDEISLVSANKVCYACNNRGFYQSKISNEIELCECVNESCQSCGASDIDKKRRMIYNEVKSCVSPCKCSSPYTEYKRIKKLYEKTNLPERYKNKNLAMDIEYDNTGTLSSYTGIVREFLAKKDISSRGFYLFGGTGCGKTHIAAAIINDLVINRGIECRYCKVSRDFIEAIKATFSKRPSWMDETESSSREIEEAFQKVPVLVMDDFGVEKTSEWVYEKFYDLIDARYEGNRLTIITSNKPRSYWKSIFENRIYSRLCEMTDELEFYNKDYREKLGGVA